MANPRSLPKTWSTPVRQTALLSRCITALCHPATYWMTGNTLHVDGGENVVG
jgi:hypothetical protein